MKKKILIVSIGRVDWNIWKPILKKLKKNKVNNFKILVTGMHLEKKYGESFKEVVKDGYKISFKIKQNYSKSDNSSLSNQLGEYIKKFSNIFRKNKFDFIFLIGDRFESLAAAISSIPFKIPIIHFHGGEVSQGSIDEIHRHMITKASHIHFCSNEIYRNRVIQMGEEKWRTYTTGSPAVYDLEKNRKYISRERFFKKIGLDSNKNFFLLNFNVETLNYEKNKHQINTVLKSLVKTKVNILVTTTNFDTDSDVINNAIKQYSKRYKNLKLYPFLGNYYFSAMKYAALMIGNSSSGIIEAASLKLPVLNLGERQKGRLKSKNVIDCKINQTDIKKNINKAMSKNFLRIMKKSRNIYFNKNFENLNSYLLKIFKIEKNKLLLKRFNDIK